MDALEHKLLVAHVVLDFDRTAQAMACLTGDRVMVAMLAASITQHNIARLARTELAAGGDATWVQLCHLARATINANAVLYIAVLQENGLTEWTTTG